MRSVWVGLVSLVLAACARQATVPERCNLCDAVAVLVRQQLEVGRRHHEAYAEAERAFCPGCGPRCRIHCLHGDEAARVAACFAAELKALGDGQRVVQEVRRAVAALSPADRAALYDHQHRGAANLAPAEFTNGPSLANATITAPPTPFEKCQGGAGEWRYEVPISGGTADAEGLHDTVYEIPPSPLTTVWRYSHVPSHTLVAPVSARAPASQRTAP